MKPQPSGWDAGCYGCGSRITVGYPTQRTHHPRKARACGLLRDWSALWGHEWAAVAWMRLACDPASHPMCSGQAGITRLFAEGDTDVGPVILT